jgi:hypothetical protein
MRVKAISVGLNGQDYVQAALLVKQRLSCAESATRLQATNIRNLRHFLLNRIGLHCGIIRARPFMFAFISGSSPLSDHR